MSVAAAAQPRAGARQRVLSLALLAAVAGASVAGIGVAAYLTSVHYAGLPLYCTGSGGCHTVQSSEYATLLSVPVALFGLVLYCVILGAALASVWGPGRAGAVAPFAVFGLALSGTMYSGYLTWLELYRIHALCAWCVASACLLASILILSTLQLLVSGRWRTALELDGTAEEAGPET